MRPTVSRSMVSLVTALLFVTSHAAVANAQYICALPATSPSDVVQLSLALDQTVVTTGDDQALAMIEVRGAEDAATARTPVSMAIVMDTSGSMAGDKIADARDAADALIDGLQEGDVLTVITYDTAALTRLANTVITSDRRAAHEAIAAIGTGGNTCISCGLEAAYSALEAAPHGHMRRVVMLSDGRANRGVTDADRLRQQAEGARELTRSVTSTMGLGADYNEELLAAVAVGGTGAYYFLPDGDAMASILDRELAALEQTVATDVAIALNPESGVTLGETQAAGARRDGTGLVFNLGQLAAGEVRRFVVPLALPEGELGQVVWATATYLPVGGEPREIELTAAIERTDDPELAEASRNPEVMAQNQRLAAASDIETAMLELGSGNRSGAQERLRRRADSLELEASMTGAPALMEEAEAVRGLADELDEDVDASRARELFLQNQARANEVRQGVDSDQMYHLTH